MITARIIYERWWEDFQDLSLPSSPSMYLLPDRYAIQLFSKSLVYEVRSNIDKSTIEEAMEEEMEVTNNVTF